MNLTEAIEILKANPQILNDVVCEMYGQYHTKSMKCVAVKYTPEYQDLQKLFRNPDKLELDHYSAFATEEDIIKYAEIINNVLMINKETI